MLEVLPPVLDEVGSHDVDATDVRDASIRDRNTATGPKGVERYCSCCLRSWRCWSWF